MKIDHLDHLVLTVNNIENTIAFYTNVLGMDALTFGEGRKALKFGSQKINLHEYGKEIEPKAGHAVMGSADLCFITTVPLIEVVNHLRFHNVTLISEPVQRTGAVGAILSVYFRDPDMNLIEVANQL